MGYDDNEYESEEDETSVELCPYCGTDVCPSDGECASCIEHLLECGKEAGEIPVDSSSCFVIIALF